VTTAAVNTKKSKPSAPAVHSTAAEKPKSKAAQNDGVGDSDDDDSSAKPGKNKASGADGKTAGAATGHITNKKGGANASKGGAFKSGASAHGKYSGKAQINASGTVDKHGVCGVRTNFTPRAMLVSSAQNEEIQ
jgi:hypothetical protein